MFKGGNMKNFNYKEVGKRIGWNFSNLKYSVVKKSDFDYYREVVKNINLDTVMLDIGCGSGEKATRYYAGAKKICLSDIEPEMLKKAKANVNKFYDYSKKTKNKFKFILLDGKKNLQFKDNTFDLVVSRHCGADMKEVFRVLKKGGIFISEDIAKKDCQELKDMFKRGQGYNDEPLSNHVMKDCIDAGFDEIKFLRSEEIEYYKTVDDLKFLLENTPILNGFNEEKDNNTLQEYVDKFSTKKGIKLIRRLYVFVLRK